MRAIVWINNIHTIVRRFGMLKYLLVSTTEHSMIGRRGPMRCALVYLYGRSSIIGSMACAILNICGARNTKIGDSGFDPYLYNILYMVPSEVLEFR